MPGFFVSGSRTTLADHSCLMISSAASPQWRSRSGRVSITSTAEEGTTFTVFIPRLLRAEDRAEDQDRDDAKAVG